MAWAYEHEYVRRRRRLLLVLLVLCYDTADFVVVVVESMKCSKHAVGTAHNTRDNTAPLTQVPSGFS